MTSRNRGRVTPNKPTWKEGWDKRNKTYNGVYAIQKGDKIFANTGVITYVGADTPQNKPYRNGGVSEDAFAKKTAQFKKVRETVIKQERGEYGVLKRLMVSIPDWKPIEGASAYTNAWLNEQYPKKYEAGWRMHPKGGLIPPPSIKPTREKPVVCKSCGAKNFHFVATGIAKPTFHWECDKCGALYSAR